MRNYVDPVFGKTECQTQISREFNLTQQRALSFICEKIGSEAVILSIGKTLDFRNAAEFKTVSKEQVDSGIHNFILDFSESGMLDSTGIGAILSLYRLVAPKEGQIFFAPVSKPTQVVVQLTKLHRVFPQFSSVEKALSNIKSLYGLIEESPDPPEVLIQVVQNITAELIKYLKSHPRELYNLKPRQFEELIAEILAGYGWEVQLTAPTKDGGYDIYAISPTQATGVQTSWIIECKKYAPERKIGVDIIRGLFGVKLDLNVANAMLATTSHFTGGAMNYKASRYDLQLRDYEGILEWINEYRPNPHGRLFIKDNQLVLPGE